MPNEVLSYLEMCQREGCNLQRGMNFRLSGGHSVVLMSVRANAPYADRWEESGTVLIYEGHDENRTLSCPDPKLLDQPLTTPNGTLTQNGRFYRAAQDAKEGKCEPEQVHVYEKLRQGIWAYAGVFELVDAWKEQSTNRYVFKFKLIAVDSDAVVPKVNIDFSSRRRAIPTHVKLQVWKRDGGRCVQCGATEELHFDHDLPFSKGGTSLTAENVQLLCARHNLEKSDKLI